MGKGKRVIDGSDKKQKKITLNPGVTFEQGKIIYDQFIKDHWPSVKAKVTAYEYNKDYKALGHGYSLDDKYFFIYPTYTSFVISREIHLGFKEIKSKKEA